MTVSDWVLICTTLFLGAVALTAPLITDWARRNLRAPKMEMSFQLSPPHCHKTYWRSPVNPDLQEPVYFFRFRLTNGGKTQLRQCEAVLQAMWVYDTAGIPHRIEEFSDINMRWSGIHTKFIDLNPRRSAYCDIGHISSITHQRSDENGIFIDVPGKTGDEPRFLLDQVEYPFSQPNCFLPGKYAFMIPLFAENAPAADLYFELSWSGKSQDTDHAMFREIVLRQVDRIPTGR